MIQLASANGASLSFDFDEDALTLTVKDQIGEQSISLSPTNVGILMGVLATWIEYTQ